MKGKYPLAPKKQNIPKEDNYSIKLKDSVNRLMKFEKNLMEKDKKPKKRKSSETVNDADEVPKKKKKKQKQETDTVPDEEDVDLFARKLQEFMQNSERNLKKKKKVVVDEDDVDLSNCKSVFRRNSGTWYVTEENVVEKPSLSSPPAMKKCNENTEEIENEDDQVENDDDQEEEINGGIEEDSMEEDGIEGSNDNESSEDDLLDSEDCELPENFNYYEMILKRVREAEEEERIREKSRRQKLKEINEQLKKELVTNPFSKPQTPASTKKVKIALELNQSQEFHEHEMQVLNSPAIPVDMNKKPTKPLLKPSPVSSPINPFYRKKKLFGTSF